MDIIETVLIEEARNQLKDANETIEMAGNITKAGFNLGLFITENPWRFVIILLLLAASLIGITIIYAHNFNKPFSTVKKQRKSKKNKNSTT